MKLHWSPRSPFVRKVMIVLHEIGMMDKVDCVRTVVGSTTPPCADILADNPLGKIPTLVIDDGSSLYDSRVICEYLDTLHDRPRLLPASGDARWEQLRRQALGDGVIDILLLMRNEYLRAAPNPDILKSCETKLFAAFGQLEADAAAASGDVFGLGDVSVACAIGQLDFRYSNSNWRQAFPNLVRWYDAVLLRPSIIATAVKDDAEPAAKDSHSLIKFS